MKISKIPGGVTAAKGFRASSCGAGIRYKGRDDMAMILADGPCAAGGVFTTNMAKAAPVIWDVDVISSGAPVRAVVVNAGIANAGTGESGLALCRAEAEEAGRVLGVPAGSVLLGSTGVIGPDLPLDRISSGISMLAASLSGTAEAGTAASRAIMTTDTVKKEFAVEFSLPAASGEGSVTVRLGGMSKGSGMIHPNMSTMLCYITTDCAIGSSLLQKAVSAVVKDTFNMISVDGDTSTNDSLIVLASGQAGNAPVTEEDESFAVFTEALFSVCRDLAVLMASDGEGATHLIEVNVTGADTKENARTLARSVVSSSLVKAMIYGRDANCGRVLCALGYAGPVFDPAAISISMEGSGSSVSFYHGGRVQPFDEEKALEILSGHDVRFVCDMNMGAEEATAWGCDLTYDYVKINGDYRT